jgi:hypothetical protein
MLKSSWPLACLGFVFCLLAGAALAGDEYPGWGPGENYCTLYDVAEYDKVKASFVEFVDVTPVPGMAPGAAIVVKDRADGENMTVHVGPKAYVFPKLKALNLRPGQKVKVYGAWAEIDGEDVLLASKVKKTENEFLKVRRTSDGFPYWAMTPEQVKKELED